MQADHPCSTIYGPVNSRRHGLSLGIHLGPAEAKVCTWSCVYCQCGFGQRLDLTDEDRALLPSSERVLEELKLALARFPNLDSVTFAGSSEPTVHPDFLKIVQGALKLREDTAGAKWILNCLSNGSELHRDNVVKACELLDEAWIKLDCGTDDLLHRLNRPLPRVGGVAEQLARIERLQKARIQTLLWKCPKRAEMSNWTLDNREALLAAYGRLKPVEIHVLTISRPTPQKDLVAVEKEELETFAAQARAEGCLVKAYH